jgi:small-conductance mechanosensitive channel
VLILGLRPFEIGDQIVIGEATEGTVERIELRATQVRTYDGRVVLVPNAEVFTSRVTNNTADPVRRGNALFRLGYDADLRRVVDAIPMAVASAEGVLQHPAPRLRVAELGASDVGLDLAFWTDSRRTDFQDAGSAVRLRLVEALRAEGIGLPNPDIRIVTPATGNAWREALHGAPVGVSGDLFKDGVAEDKHDHEQGQTDKENDLGDTDGGARNAGKTERAGDQTDNQNN